MFQHEISRNSVLACLFVYSNTVAFYCYVSRCVSENFSFVWFSVNFPFCCGTMKTTASPRTCRKTMGINKPPPAISIEGGACLELIVRTAAQNERRKEKKNIYLNCYFISIKHAHTRSARTFGFSSTLHWHWWTKTLETLFRLRKC